MFSTMSVPPIYANPAIAKNIAEKVLQGVKHSDIAEEYGVERHTISNAIKSTQVRDLIEKTYNDIAGLAPKVFQVYDEELNRKPTSTDDRKIRVTVAKEVAGITGISPIRDSRSNVFLTNILNPTVVALSPVVAQALARLGVGVDEGYVDAELCEEDEE
jgi:hypothetical protein